MNNSPEELKMSTLELEHLRRFAATSRSRPNFEAALLKLDVDNGKWQAGKKDANGRRLGADVLDAMGGFQKFKNKIPTLAIVRIADGIAPPKRDELDERDENRWSDNRDPWQAVSILPVFDPETHELFIFSSTAQGGRDAIAYLIEAYADNCTAHPEEADKLPLVELHSDHYTNKHGRVIHKPVFDIVDWIARPSVIRRLKPPPLEILAIEDKSAPAPAAGLGRPTNPKRKIKVPGASSDDIDDEIPF
jgi:hypothetical protein